MQHVVTQPMEPVVCLGGRLRLHQVPAATDNLVWIAECTATGEAAVVDGPDAEAALAYAERHGIRLGTVWNTHTHGDHVGINRDLQRRGRLDRMRVVGPARVADDVPGITDPVDEGDEVRLGELVARVLLTEGHLDGHVSFALVGESGVVFCGDTLFAGGCGYLFSGPPAKMFDSLMRLAALPADTRVCCAHEYTQDNLRFAWSVEPDNEALAERIRRVWALRAEGRCAVPSTIDEERATNPFLRPGSATIRANVGVDGGFADVFAATRALKDQKAYKATGDDVLPL